MSHSRNEASALITKAAVGAGFPWALAQEISKAFSTIAQPTSSEWQALIDALVAPTEGMIFTTHAGLLQIENARICSAGPAVVDWLVAGMQRAELLELDCPVLLDAFLRAGQAEYGYAFMTETNENGVVQVTAKRNENPSISQSLPRIIFPQETYDALIGLAARTYVPESDASRLSGAGAGLTDND